MQRIQVSTVLRPRGLRGELKCTAFPYGIEPKTVYVDGREIAVEQFSNQQNFTYLYLAGVTTVEVAERFRNKSIEIDRTDMNIGADEILTSDLVGYTVIDQDGEKMGVVRGVENYGAGDIIDCGTFMFPYEDDFIVETDTKTRVLTINKDRL